MELDFVEECLSVLTRTPATLDALLGDLPDTWTAATEGPGTWSPFVVIGHLIHAESRMDSTSSDHSGVWHQPPL